MGATSSVLSANNKLDYVENDYKYTVRVVDSEKDDHANYRLGLNQFVKASFTKSNQFTALKRLLKNTDFLAIFLKFLKSDYALLKELSASDACIIKNTMINLESRNSSGVHTDCIDENDGEIVIPTICVINKQKMSTKPTHGYLMVMVAMKYLEQFLQSYFYKIWKGQVDLKDDYLNKALNKVLESSECSDKEVESVWSSPIQLLKAFQFIHPNHCSKISRSGYLSSFVATVESLPYGVSISVIGNGSKKHDKVCTLAYVNEMYSKMSGYVRKQDSKSTQGKQLENIPESYWKDILRKKTPYCISVKNSDTSGIPYEHMMGAKVVTSVSDKCHYLISLRFDVTLESNQVRSNKDIQELLDMLPSTIE